MIYIMKKTGWIEVICGSMFSGKSEELIRRLRRALYAKQKVQVFKPGIDNRYSETDVVSHNGTKITAQTIEGAQPSLILDLIYEDTEVIGIDEIQFFSEEIIEILNILADKGKRVIVAGLDQDFRGEPFGAIPEILCLAEMVTKLQAICAVCGNPASRTQRIIDGKPANYNDPIVLVGATESYEPRCRNCHDVPKFKTF